ncbi:C-terminal binding protein [Kushneria phosphatilytica]|uniref:C-terminal binding protein n=1 Tax=Kushneria phosphatilytica TaxID=657387 RepID=A0A1S1NSZ1_9GAMM|nr:C-terminal binding protein [Kushneria phosphatilytica]OHV08412.1 C-terminal binding protein [Kushneria phosphatilytica]QEL09838.1 C-terminal binding protein [Kushneria phosphatilytica]
MKIVITDCDHADVEIERDVIDRSGGTCELYQDVSPEGIIANAHGADGLLVQYGRITGEVLDALPSVRVLSRYGVGVDTLDVQAATERGVAVCNVPDYGTEAVSDHAIALALTVARDTAGMDRRMRDGQPDLAASWPIHGFAGRRFGVVGAGAIGSATARKAAGLGFDVVVFDSRYPPGSTTAEGWPVISLDELLVSSHVVSIHVPLTEQTHHLIDAEALSRMRSDAVLINTARGGVVDTAALVTALQSRQVLGAGLDVLEEEPLPADHPLMACSRVVLTPHAGFYTEESYAELKRRTVQNAVDVIQGRRPGNLLNPEVLHSFGQ